MSNKKIIDFLSGSISDSTQGYLGDISTGALTRTSFRAMKDYFTSGSLSTPSWDSTLAIGNTTSRTIEQDKTSTLGTGQLWYLWKPKDYGSTSGNGTVGQWLSYMDDSFVDGVGTRDHVFSWHSYNYPAPGFSPVADAAYSFRAERNFHQGTNNFEFHIPEIKTSGGTLARLFSIYGSRDSGNCFSSFILDSQHMFTVDVQDHEWLTFGTGATRNVTTDWDGRYGSGGMSGTGTNDVLLRFFDGSGNGTTFQQTGGSVFFRPSGDYSILSPMRHMDIVPSGHFLCGAGLFNFGFDPGTLEMSHSIPQVSGYIHTWYIGARRVAQITDFGLGTLSVVNALGCTSSGSSAVRASNDGTAICQIGAQGTAAAAYGIYVANSAVCYSNSPVGLILMSDNATGNIQFATGGNTLKSTLKTTGQWQFNTYGSGTFTGSMARVLAVDSTGSIIEIPTTSFLTNPTVLGSVPTSVSASGVAGEVRFVSGSTSAVYVCVSTNHWLRSTLTTF